MTTIRDIARSGSRRPPAFTSIDVIPACRHCLILILPRAKYRTIAAWIGDKPQTTSELFEMKGLTVRGLALTLFMSVMAVPGFAAAPDEPMNLRCVGERVSTSISQAEKKTPFSVTYSLNPHTHQLCISANCEAYFVCREGVLQPLSNRPPPLDVCGSFHELYIDLEKLSLHDSSGGCGGGETVTAVCRRIDQRELDKEAEIRRSNTVATIPSDGSLGRLRARRATIPQGQ